MKLISWNVNGIRACIRKNCLEPVIENEKPDVFCIQETKAHPDQVDKVLHDYEHHFWNSAKKPGYSGTAIFSKIKPKSVAYGLGKEEHDQEGRVIAVEFDTFYLVNVYVPNSGRGLPRLKYRKTWDNDFLQYLKRLEQKKPVVVCGDFNVAHTEIDLAHPKENYNKTAGYTQVEIDGFVNFMNAQFIDTFREFERNGGHYTYWGQWNNLRARNIGWRIDYFLVSKSLRSELKRSFILSIYQGSDHCPVGIEINDEID
ncbi:exodeoxyribonuclease III [Candidatus Woesearchaeota archaeon]|nr:exodeoxyribonuclease III [Candidatus Woesearchaeota archaeon]